MTDQALAEIQQLQFTDLNLANERLREFLNKFLPFHARTVNIRPLAVSLNSINGFLTTDDDRRFFVKTHVEPQSVINEYYNSQILAEANYPLVRPLFGSTEWGRQVLVYDVVDFPTLFDVARDLESGKRRDAGRVIAIQQQADAELLTIYRNTLQYSDPEEHAQGPVHQLFHHRLTGGRFTSFYQNKDISLPGGVINFERLTDMTWVINGVRYRHTLGELVRHAQAILDPSRSSTPSVIGHGDAHNGNVFLDEANASLIYFDPAFAGRHSPLLDLTKPLFHNVFAVWMYFPREVAENLLIRQTIQGETIVVHHDYAPSEIRTAFFQSKTRLALEPLLQELQARGWLPPEWQVYLKSALLCCPLLTMNLGDPEKFPPEIALLGLAMTIVMGSESVAGPEGMLDRELARLSEKVTLSPDAREERKST